MTVHTIRIECENPDGYTIDEIRTAVEDWVSNHQHVLTSESYTVRELIHGVDNPNTENTPYLAGYWRFSMDESTTTLLDEIETTLKDYVGWAVIRYHECVHDGTENSPCAWDSSMERSFGTDPR